MSRENNFRLVPRLRFPEFLNEANWVEDTLINIAGFRRGSFPQPYGLPEWYDDINGMPFIQVYDVGEDFRLKPKTKNKISKLGAEQSVYIPKGTVIITIQGSIGRVAITQYDAYIDRTLLLFEEFYIELDKTFFAYLLFLLFEIEKLKAPGGIIKTITKEVLSQFVVKLPSPKEQQKIAACLSSLDEVIHAESQKLEILQDHKKGLLQNLLPQVGETFPKFRFSDFEGSEEWVFDTFSEYIKLYRGSSPRPIQNYFTTDESGVNWIKIGDTKNANNFIIKQVEERITPEGAEKSRKVSVGELILANSMSFGKTYQLAIEGYIYDGWFVLREYEEYFDKQFLLQLLNSDYMQTQYKKLSAGGIVQNISSDIVYNTILSHTSLEEQRQIASCLISLDEMISAQNQKVEALKLHKKGLLQGMFPDVNTVSQ
jgi:type I restriction enzyme S subunit